MEEVEFEMLELVSELGELLVEKRVFELETIKGLLGIMKLTSHLALLTCSLLVTFKL